MFFYLSKILQFLFSPFLWICAVLVYSAVVKNSQKKKKSLIITLCALLFFSNSFICEEMMRLWEIPVKHLDNAQIYDAGIVLGGMLSYDSKNDRVQYHRGTDRLLQAVHLYKTGRIKKILFSGGSGWVLKPEIREATYAREFLMEVGIPEEDIIIELNSKNTHENAMFTKDILIDNFKNQIYPDHKSKMLLISSGFHLRRAQACFTKAGITTDLYSTDRYSGPRHYEFEHLFIPSEKALLDWNLFIHEMSGYLIYKIAGYC